MRLYEDVDKNNYLESIQISLISKKGSQRFPRDGEVINSLKEKDVYNIKPKNRMYFLERLENHNNIERVNLENNPCITIEHIFPQKPHPNWKKEIDEKEYNIIKEQYLNTISNLTLSGNNGKLGNKTFCEKRDMNIDNKEQGYKYSRLWLNRDLQNFEKWTLSEIEDRFEKIKNRFLEIWQFPKVDIPQDLNFNEINIFDAEDPTNKRLEYAIFFDEKKEYNSITQLYSDVIKTFYSLQPQSFYTTDLAEKLALTDNPDKLRNPLAINNTYYIESNIDSKTKFERLKHTLTIFSSEDELTIRYKE
jgi:hypothetical protein